MRLTIESGDEEELILRCPDPDAPHIRALLRMLGDMQRRLPARTETELCFLSPSDVLYAEYIDRGVFLYTAESVYATPLSLTELEAEGLFRCAKSMAVRIGAIRSLKSRANGRILATLHNGEQVLISRRYAAALRRALLSGSASARS